MIDAFPLDSWLTEDGALNEEIGAFWQYSAGSGTGTWTLTIVGMIVTFLAIVGWVYMDDRMLTRHAERLRAMGFGGARSAGSATMSSDNELEA